MRSRWRCVASAPCIISLAGQNPVQGYDNRWCFNNAICYPFPSSIKKCRVPSLDPCNQFDTGMRWSYSGIIPGMHCIQIGEPSDPHTWGDNYLCFKHDYGIKWSNSGTIPGMKCTQLVEPSDPHTWNDNYLCVPATSTFAFSWSNSGAIANACCVQMIEPSDPHTWSDNYLCLKNSEPMCGKRRTLLLN